MAKTIDFIDELKWRGLFFQSTDEAGLRTHLDLSKGGQRSAYIGYDPTAPSLTIGNLVTIMMLVHFWRAGHVPVAVVGGGTGMIGDPSGKSAERQLMTEETVRANIDGQRPIFERIFANAAAIEGRERFTPRLINNGDWLMKIGFIEALRDIGKHFSVNEMIKRDSVRDRLEKRDQGISYTEFSYILLQSYDFLVLFRDFAKHGLPLPVTLQMGGSDQWGNIVGGMDLIRADRLVGRVEKRKDCVDIDTTVEAAFARLKQTLAEHTDSTILNHFKHGERPFIVPEPAAQAIRRSGSESLIAALEAFESANREIFGPISFGLTAPLVTKADGGKFGKTESGAIWLTPDRTSAYAYYQFWLNAADADVGRFLRIFTLLDQPAIEAIEREHAADPGRRIAQRALAQRATELLHGPEAVASAEAAAAALFSGDIASLPESTLREALAEVPASDHDKALLGAGMSLVDLLPLTSLAKSKSEARQFLTEGSVSVNGKKVDAKHSLTAADLLHGSLIALRRGKKNWHLTRWT